MLAFLAAGFVMAEEKKGCGTCQAKVKAKADHGKGHDGHGEHGEAHGEHGEHAKARGEHAKHADVKKKCCGTCQAKGTAECPKAAAAKKAAEAKKKACCATCQAKGTAECPKAVAAKKAGVAKKKAVAVKKAGVAKKKAIAVRKHAGAQKAAAAHGHAKAVDVHTGASARLMKQHAEMQKRQLARITQLLKRIQNVARQEKAEKTVAAIDNAIKHQTEMARKHAQAIKKQAGAAKKMHAKPAAKKAPARKHAPKKAPAKK